MKRRAFSTLLAATVMAFLPGLSHASRPTDAPRVDVASRGETIQRARLAAWCWPGPDGGMGCGEKDPLPWPRGKRVVAGSLVKFRVRWPQEPRRLSVTSFRSVNDKGRPPGRGSELEASKHRIERAGKTVAWDVVFRIRSERRHYLRLLAHFRKGTLVWHGHVRAR